MNSELQRLNTRLCLKFKDYISMIATGSIATNDPFMQGRSDNDILLIFENNPEVHLPAIEDILSESELDDTFLLTPLTKEHFIGPKNTTFDFTNRYRSRTLFGEDLVLKAKLPSRETTKKIYTSGLEKVRRRLQSALANTSYWSTEKIRDKFWKQFKHAFMFLAIKGYYNSGEYPINRVDIARQFDSDELRYAVSVLHSIDLRSKEEILGAARGVVSYLDYKNI
ncbi:MAG: hypothetical protein ABIH72_01895 [archaeon]